MMLCGTVHHGLKVTAVARVVSWGVGVRRAPTTVRWRASTRPFSTKAAVNAGTLTMMWRSPRSRGIQRQRSMLARISSRRAWSSAGVAASAVRRPTYCGWAGNSPSSSGPTPPCEACASSSCWRLPSMLLSGRCQSTRLSPRTWPPLRSVARRRKVWLATLPIAAGSPPASAKRSRSGA
jgi:hypothetical protein